MWMVMMKPKLAAFVLGVLLANASLAAAFTPPQSQTRGGVVVTTTTAPRRSRSSSTTVLFADTVAPKKSESKETEETKASNVYAVQEQTKQEEEEEVDADDLMQQIKDAGTAGIISYILWEWAFWGVSVPVVVVGYKQVTGHWPDLSYKEDIAKLGAEAFAFVNFARFAVPLRLGLALGTTPWVQDNVVDKIPFLNKEEKESGDDDKVTLGQKQEEEPQVAVDVMQATQQEIKEAQQEIKEMGDLTLAMETEAPTTEISTADKPKKKGILRRIRSLVRFRRQANKE